MYRGVQPVLHSACLKQHAVPKQSSQARVCARMQIESWGYHTIPVSAASGQGLAQLNEALKGKVSVVAGPSGASLSLLRAVYAGRILCASACSAELCQVHSHLSSGRFFSTLCLCRSGKVITHQLAEAARGWSALCQTGFVRGVTVFHRVIGQCGAWP